MKLCCAHVQAPGVYKDIKEKGGNGRAKQADNKRTYFLPSLLRHEAWIKNAIDAGAEVKTTDQLTHAYIKITKKIQEYAKAQLMHVTLSAGL